MVEVAAFALRQECLGLTSYSAHLRTEIYCPDRNVSADFGQKE